MEKSRWQNGMINYTNNLDYLIISVSGRKNFMDIELLLLARSIPFTVEKSFGIKRFYIPLNYESFARNEIQLFQQENENWPIRNREDNTAMFSFSRSHLFIILVLSFFHWSVQNSSYDANWLDSGMFNTEKVLSGEWFRSVTALTLHADISHLMGNCFGLFIFVNGVHQFVGGGFAWFLVLLAGAMGNYMNGIFYQVSHNSIGASTAVFGAVGILGAFGIRRYYYERRIQARAFIPVIGALGLFAMLGTDPRSDVVAHLFGLISGMVVGFSFIPFLGVRFLKSKILQLLVFTSFWGIIFISWKIQLAG